MNHPTQALAITSAQREQLTTWAHSHTAPHRQVIQAQVLLFAADGLANTRIAAQVGVAVISVRRWRARFAADGLAGVGRPPFPRTRWWGSI